METGTLRSNCRRRSRNQPKRIAPTGSKIWHLPGIGNPLKSSAGVGSLSRGDWKTRMGSLSHLSYGQRRWPSTWKKFNGEFDQRHWFLNSGQIWVMFSTSAGRISTTPSSGKLFPKWLAARQQKQMISPWRFSSFWPWNPTHPYNGCWISATIAGELPSFPMNGPQLQLQCYSRKGTQPIRTITDQFVYRVLRTSCLPPSSNNGFLMQGYRTDSGNHNSDLETVIVLKMPFSLLFEKSNKLVPSEVVRSACWPSIGRKPLTVSIWTAFLMHYAVSVFRIFVGKWFTTWCVIAGFMSRIKAANPA